MIQIYRTGPSTPHLPRCRWATPLRLTAAALVHVTAAIPIVAMMKPMLLTPQTSPANRAVVSVEQEWDDEEITHVVFLVSDFEAGAGGGGGGSRQPGPIRRAQGVGSDAITLRVTSAPPAAEYPTLHESPPPANDDTPRWAPLILDAASLASGTFEQTGLPDRGLINGLSTGPGSGGGVGTGQGTGIGSGYGPGLGPGSGGGTGGGVYRPGGAVTAPRVLLEAKPPYTDDALRRRVQGSVLLELIVTRDGRPTNIRVVRSLDPGGLDQAAVTAAERWRFDPGRLNGAPVDVLVTLIIDFSIW